MLQQRDIQNLLTPFTGPHPSTALIRDDQNLSLPLTTWAKARHRVCRIIQVFSKAERVAMVPLPFFSLPNGKSCPPTLLSAPSPLSYLAQWVEGEKKAFTARELRGERDGWSG